MIVYKELTLCVTEARRVLDTPFGTLRIVGRCVVILHGCLPAIIDCTPTCCVVVIVVAPSTDSLGGAILLVDLSEWPDERSIDSCLSACCTQLNNGLSVIDPSHLTTITLPWSSSYQNIFVQQWISDSLISYLSVTAAVLPALLSMFRQYCNVPCILYENAITLLELTIPQEHSVPMNVLDNPSVPFVRAINDFDDIISTDSVPLRVNGCDLMLLISLIKLLIDICRLDTYYLSLIVDQPHVVLTPRGPTEGSINLQYDSYVFVLIECDHFASLILDALGLVEKEGCTACEA